MNYFHTDQWLSEIEFDFHGGLVNILKVTDVKPERKPFTYIRFIEFRPVEGYEITEQRENISRILTEQGLNHAIAQTYGGSIILTEEPFDFDPLIFKLTTGTDIGPGQHFDLNEFLAVNGMSENYRSLLRTTL